MAIELSEVLAFVEHCDAVAERLTGELEASWEQLNQQQRDHREVLIAAVRAISLAQILRASPDGVNWADIDPDWPLANIDPELLETVDGEEVWVPSLRWS